MVESSGEIDNHVSVASSMTLSSLIKKAQTLRVVGTRPELCEQLPCVLILCLLVRRTRRGRESACFEQVGSWLQRARGRLGCDSSTIRVHYASTFFMSFCVSALLILLSGVICLSRAISRLRNLNFLDCRAPVPKFYVSWCYEQLQCPSPRVSSVLACC